MVFFSLGKNPFFKEGLIRDSLINKKLISGLNTLGLDANDYSLFLGDTIFELMGMDKKECSDTVYEKIFLPLMAKVHTIDFSAPERLEMLNILSLHIYYELMEVKETL